jgi:hypothetical protein
MDGQSDTGLRIQLVLAVSEPTRFGVVIDSAPYKTIPERSPYALFHSLLGLDIPPDLAAEEVRAMLPMEVATSNS